MLRFRILSALAICAAALASTSLAQAQAKIGVVNFQKAMLETAEAKKAQNDLVAEFKPRTDELDKVNRELSDDTTQLQNSQGKLSPQGEAELTAKAQREQRQAERLNQDLQDDLQKKRDEITQRLGSRAVEIVRKVMTEKGLDMIVDSSALVSFKEALDITAEVTTAYDKAYPVQAAAAASKP